MQWQILMPSQKRRISYFSDAEYSGCVIPHSLAAINMIAETAAEEAIAILEADIKNAPGIMSMNNVQELKSTQSIRQYAALTASLLECAVLLTSSSDQKTGRFVPDLLRVAFERADSLADALEEMEVTYVKMSQPVIRVLPGAFC
jgi:hypothetical protein